MQITDLESRCQELAPDGHAFVLLSTGVAIVFFDIADETRITSVCEKETKFV